MSTMDKIFTNTSSLRKEDKRDWVCLALKHVWSFLENYLLLANTHGAEFILHHHWETFVPETCQQQLLAMTREELINLAQRSMDSSMPCPRSVNHGESKSYTTSNMGKEDANEHWLSSFIAGSHRCHLENMTTFFTVLDAENSNDELTSVQESRGVIQEAMSEKKSHEIKAVAMAVSSLFRSCKADVVIDVGSGKGYMGCELAHHQQIPVLGLDSCDTNTRGASRRDLKLARQLNKLAKQRERKNQAGCEANGTDKFLVKISEPQQTQCENCSVGEDLSSDSFYTSGRTDCGGCCLDLSRASFKDLDRQVVYQDIVIPGSNHVLDNVRTSAACGDSYSVKQCPKEGHVILSDIRDGSMCEFSQDRVHNTKHCLTTVSESAGRNFSVIISEGRAEANNYHKVGEEVSPELKTPALSLYVPVTLAVHPDMNLHQILEDYGAHLGINSPASAHILLTGLHACGSLSVTAVRLFLQNPAVVGLCFVGCCYQLMEESPVGGEISEKASLTHFPLSEFGKQLNLHLGRNARNLASQSVERIQTSGQLQGIDFCWRAMLAVFLHELGVAVPDRIVGMRGLQKRSSSFQEYVQAAMGKLQLNPDLVKPELVASIEDKYKDTGEKMSAFFQLKLLLAPVIETLIVLDRYLYLLEQDSVQDAHIVRLFDPVISPRCYAIVAWKSKNMT